MACYIELIRENLEPVFLWLWEEVSSRESHARRREKSVPREGEPESARRTHSLPYQTISGTWVSQNPKHAKNFSRISAIADF